MAKARRKTDIEQESNPRKVTPLYHQVYVVLRDKIQHGEYPADQPLPGEHQLAEEFGISRVTLRHTLKNLEVDGYVVRKRGVGTFPLARPADLPDRYNIGGMLEPGRFHDAPAKVRTLSVRRIDCPAHIAKLLDSDDDVLRLQRLRSVNGNPFTVLTVYLPISIAQQLDRAKLRKKAALVVLEQAGFVLARADQSITAVAADDSAAQLLKVPVGAPLIAMSALFTGKDEESLAVLEGLFRPELYEYQTAALREGNGAKSRWVTIS